MKPNPEGFVRHAHRQGAFHRRAHQACRRRLLPGAAWMAALLLAALPALGGPPADAGGTNGAVRSERALVAVAANFAEVLERLQADYEREGPHTLSVTTGSTGKLYAQISHGAPFDVLLAADQARPERLVTEGLAVAGSRFTYAQGRLTLWSADADRIGADGAAVLRAGAFRKLAIANPELAPYGLAARQTLAALGVYEALRDRLVMGENVAQAHALVATGNAELGLVALSSVTSTRNTVAGSRWDVPENLHEPIRQDAVLLLPGEDNSAARDLLAYLRRPAVRALIREYGYRTD